METYHVKPIFQYSRPDFHETVEVPGSKSITNRALMLAALAQGETILEGVLFSDDSRHFLSCLQSLGFKLDIDEENHRVSVTGHGGVIPKKEASIYVGSAGTCARFLTAMLGCCPGTWHMDASDQMRRRPMAPLLGTLKSLGCEVVYEGQEGHFPFTLISKGISASEATVDIGDSSQFLSALLMAGVILDHDFTIHITGTHGLSYIHMTMEMMRQFGAQVSSADGQNYIISGHSHYKARHYQIEPDMSGAAYFYAMAAISGGSMLVKHIHSDSLQGDIKVLDSLEAMGCKKEETPEGIRLYGPHFSRHQDLDKSENDTDPSVSNGVLCGIDIDLGSYSDQTLTLAAIAPYASSPVTLRNIGHIRLQECDRVHAIVSNLQRCHIKAIATENDITIYPGSPQPAEIETFDDHRVAMAFTLTGLKASGITILDPMCCRKTFENYFDLVDSITDKYC